MPIFAGIVAVMFAKIFEYLSSRFALGVALGLAAAATSIAAIAVLHVALRSVWTGLSLVAPTIVLEAFTLVMPSNFGAFLTGIILVDVVRAAYDYWRQTAMMTLIGKVS